MATWKTAAELCRRYVVGPERLADYSRRGNLPMLAEEGAPALFDEDFVARFFRLRHAQGAPLTHGGHLGVLGEVRLGVHTLPASPGPREMRRRAIRQGHTPVVGIPLRPTGTG